MRYAAPLMLAAALTLSACATPTPFARPTPTAATEPVVDGSVVACSAFGPIGFSRLSDTLETIAAVKAHNAAWEALCKR